jgi:multicomponent Na+:H+ antiporter subunit D
VQDRYGRVGQERLHGRARALRGTAFLFFAGGLMIASLPPFGSFLGKSMLDDAAIKAGYRFMPAMITLVSALTGAAVLRAGVRVFLGRGEPSKEPSDTPDADTERESDEQRERTPALMFLPACALLVGAIGTGVWFGFADLVQTAAERFVDVGGYAAAIAGKTVPTAAGSSSSPEWFDYLYAGAAVVLAIGIAALDLWLGPATRTWRRFRAGAAAAIRPVRVLHTGRIGDYTAALVLGVGILGGLMAMTLQ